MAKNPREKQDIQQGQTSTNLSIQTQKKKPERISGSLLGKMAAVLVTEDAVEVRTISSVLLIVGLWLASVGMFILSMFFMNFLITAAMTIGGGIGGFFAIYKLYPGKLDRRIEYKDIVSFVTDGGEIIINLRDNYMYTVKISPKKQPKLLMAVAGVLRENAELKLVRMGDYYKIFPRAEAAEEKKDGKKHGKKA